MKDPNARHGYQHTTLCATLIALVTFATVTAQAASCPTTTITANVVLGTDYTATSSTVACFNLPGGYDLNLNGHTITCTSGACAEAVKATANNTIVEDTVGTGGIYGPFAVGVRDAKVVRDVLVDGATTGVSGLSYTTTVMRNVITDASTCIDVELDNNTDEVQDNFCDIAGGIGVQATGTSSGSGAKVQRNFIRGYGSNGAFRNQDTTRLQFLNNICADAAAAGDPFVVTTTNKAVSGNVCDVQDVLCPVPNPFVFP